MFESIVIYRETEVGGIDFGLLAESLLFYGHVTLVVTDAQLRSLLRVCGHETVRELFDMQVLSLSFLENGIGVRTFNANTVAQTHDFIVYDMARAHLQNCLPDALEELVGRKGRARRLAERLKHS